MKRLHKFSISGQLRWDISQKGWFDRNIRFSERNFFTVYVSCSSDLTTVVSSGQQSDRQIHTGNLMLTLHSGMLKKRTLLQSWPRNHPCSPLHALCWPMHYKSDIPWCSMCSCRARICFESVRRPCWSFQIGLSCFLKTLSSRDQTHSDSNCCANANWPCPHERAHHSRCIRINWIISITKLLPLLCIAVAYSSDDHEPSWRMKSLWIMVVNVCAFNIARWISIRVSNSLLNSPI